MSKYDRGYKEVTTEEEGLYHERKIESSNPRNYTTRSKEIVPITTTTSKYHGHSSGDEDNDNFSEWTTSKKKVHHKTRQVETRVSRQLLVEDGKVIADSGPQVVTRIKEDNKVEECEKEKAPKNKSKFEALENAPEGENCSGRVLGEKKEIQRVSREIREENMQYHDERYKELTGKDVHQRAIKAPHELITINDQQQSSMPRGKMVHYSNRGKKYEDTDEILEVAKLAIDGSITKEVTRKKHHEEFSEDEKPDEKGEAEALRHKPEVVRSSRRGVDYVNDFDNISDPIQDDGAGRHSSSKHRQHHGHKTHHEDEAFPRYEIDPLLNSLRDEDFKPATRSHQSGATNYEPPTSGHHRSGGGGRYKEHRLERKEHSESSSDDDESYVRHHRTSSPHQPHQFTPVAAGRHSDETPVVEIPEEYRHHKERLLSSRGKSPRERSFSPANKSHLSHRSAKSHRSHKEDASVQAHLTDEEEEKRSSSSSSVNANNQSHAKTTKQLQRQSTVNSHRNYYYGNQRQRSPSIHSYSSTSLDDPKERLREQGARSKDSGFKSPHSMRTGTPISTAGSQQQIYSVSSKSKKNHRNQEPDVRGAASPTPSAGQRSVKTTTTTMSAGLTDRPISRAERGTTNKPNKMATNTNVKRRETSSKKNSSSLHSDDYICDHYKYKQESSRRNHEKSGRIMSQQQQHNINNNNNRTRIIKPRLLADKDVQCSMDEIESSISSSSSANFNSRRMPSATTIKVPYKEMSDRDGQEEEIDVREDTKHKLTREGKDRMMVKEADGDGMSLEEDIAKLRQRLDNINSRTITLSSSSSKAKRRGVNKQQSADISPGPMEHFDYKTIVANVQPVPKRGQNTIEAYNVKVIEHDSPFYNNNNNGHHQSRSVSELSNSIAQLELLSSDLGSSSSGVGGSTTNKNSNQSANLTTPTTMMMDNNNEANFNLNDFVKHRAIPIMTDGSKESDSLDLDLDDDRASIMSSCSLRSSRTYDIRYITNNNNTNNNNSGNNEEDDDDDDLNDEKHFPVGRLELDELGNEKKPAAWIYDIRDGSSTTIVAPPKPAKPEPAMVDAKELAQSRGGRSYYLELIEPKQEEKRDEMTVQGGETFYSRWSSQGALSGSQSSGIKPRNDDHSSPQRRANSPIKPKQQVMVTTTTATGESRKSRQILPASIIYQGQRQIRPLSSSSSSQQQQQLATSHTQTSGIGNRSKSSSCLASSIRPTKYSIYGGLRKSNNGNKPVPRLSYSRAIGPKSQRQIDAQPKTPSRYLKMK